MPRPPQPPIDDVTGFAQPTPLNSRHRPALHKIYRAPWPLGSCILSAKPKQPPSGSTNPAPTISFIMATQQPEDYQCIWEGETTDGIRYQLYIVQINCYPVLNTEGWHPIVCGFALVANRSIRTTVGFRLILRTTQPPAHSYQGQTSPGENPPCIFNNEQFQQYTSAMINATTDEEQREIVRSMTEKLLEQTPLKDDPEAIGQIVAKLQHITSSLAALTNAQGGLQWACDIADSFRPIAQNNAV